MNSVAPELGNDVLFGIAQLALERVDGMRPLTPPPRVGEFLTGRRAKGIRIEREGDTVDVSLNVTVKYGLEIPKVSERAIAVVRESVASMTGLTVRSVRVSVVGIDVEDEGGEDRVDG